jgi:putative transposase
MTDYCPAYSPGALWFFTVNLAERRGNRWLIDKIDELRRAFEYTQQRRPFRMEAVVILPDHLHCIWTLPAMGRGFRSCLLPSPHCHDYLVIWGEARTAPAKGRVENRLLVRVASAYRAEGSGLVFCHDCDNLDPYPDP